MGARFGFDLWLPQHAHCVAWFPFDRSVPEIIEVQTSQVGSCTDNWQQNVIAGTQVLYLQMQ